MALYMVVENFRNGDALPVYFEVHPGHDLEGGG